MTARPPDVHTVQQQCQSTAAAARKRRRARLQTKQPFTADNVLSMSSSSHPPPKKKARKTATTSNTPCQNQYTPKELESMTKEELSTWRREARRVRNRESAALSRKRTRDRIEELEREVEEWKRKYYVLSKQDFNSDELEKEEVLHESDRTDEPPSKVAEIEQKRKCIVSPCSSPPCSPLISPVLSAPLVVSLENTNHRNLNLEEENDRSGERNSLSKAEMIEEDRDKKINQEGMEHKKHFNEMISRPA